MLFGKFINKYYLKYAFFFIFGIALLVVVDLAQLQLPFYLGRVVEIFEDADFSGYTDEVKKSIIDIFLKVLLYGGIMFVGRILFRNCIFYASSNIECDLRHDMFLKAEKLSVSYYHEHPVGNVMSWLTNDLETIEEFLAWGTVMLVDASFLTIAGTICLFITCWQLALIACFPILLIVVWGLLVESQMSKQWGNTQKAYDKLYDFSQESFTGIRVIKAFVKETQQVLSFGKVAKLNKDVNIKFARTEIIFDIIITLIINAISSMIIILGGAFVLAFRSDPIVLFGAPVEFGSGKLVEFIGYFDTLIWPMIALGQVVAMRSRSKSSLKRISAFLSVEVEICNPENAIVLENVKGDIEFNNFSFTYPSNDEPSLKNVSLKIKQGEKIGIVGKIGCGKTTLVNSLLRLYNIDKSAVKIDGVDLMECDIASLRNAIAYVPQDNFLFSDTIKNNIAFSNKDMDDDEAIKAAKFAGVHDDIEDFADKYETVSGERGVTLSGGQKQRISIARAYAKNAPIMILDDSVSAVDVNTEKTILENIEEQRKGKTTIVIASRVSTVSHLDRILVLNNGEVEAFDTHENLLKKSQTYKTMVLLQELESEKGGM